MSLQILLKGQLNHMSNYYDLLAISSDGPDLKAVAKEEGVRTRAVNLSRVISPFRDIVALIKLTRIIRQERPFIVHTHTPKAGLLGMLAAYFVNVPVRLHTVAGLPLMEATGVKRKVLELAERVTYGCATKVFPNSKNLATFIIENRFCTLSKIKVIGTGSSNGINTTYFNLTPTIEQQAKLLRSSLALHEKDFVFVFVGRLVSDKGVNELLQAFQLIKHGHSFVRLLLVGPFEHSLDPLNKSSLEIIESDEDIITCGFIKDIRPYLALSNALVFPSYREGFPNVPMQAGCFHLPCIVSDINGCNEIIEHEVNGLLVPVKNVQALKNAMARLLAEHVLLQTLKKNARRMIVERYDQNIFWDLLLKQYEQEQMNYELSQNAESVNV